MPALPLDQAGKYVVAAYLVFIVILLVYIFLMSSRLRKIERTLAELEQGKERAEGGSKS